MPKGGRKGSGKCLADDKQADVTLNDFANSRVSATRLRKPTTNSLVREVKELCIVGNKSWTENEAVEDESSEIDYKTSTDNNLEKRHSERKKGCLQGGSASSSAGVLYPLDLWFLLGEYVRPEDVQTFATICKSALYVVQTYKFWISIYKRYFRCDIELPARLQPNCISRPHCLRACVVRALYFLYPPFVGQLWPRSGPLVDNKAYDLVRLRCCSVWHEQLNNNWIFYFKFVAARAPPPSKGPGPALQDWSRLASREYLQQDLIEEVNANPEEGCRLLCITGNRYVALPPTVMGKHLEDVRVTLSQDLRHHHVRLMFSSVGYRRSCPKAAVVSAIDEVIHFDPVEKMQVMCWWYPDYPFCEKF